MISAYFEVELRGQRSVYVNFDDFLSDKLIRTVGEDDTQCV